MQVNFGRRRCDNLSGVAQIKTAPRGGRRRYQKLIERW
nr:MAG TPA: hypothetical protein [Caudoviricetes sp.]